jgi:L-asparagine transporter-like permease
MVSSLGQLQAQMFTTCYMTAGLADKGLLPALFSQRNQHGTPVRRQSAAW